MNFCHECGRRLVNYGGLAVWFMCAECHENPYKCYCLPVDYVEPKRDEDKASKT